MYALTNEAKIRNKALAFLKRPNAVPVFCTYVSDKNGRIEIDSPSAKLFRIANLVTLSTVNTETATIQNIQCLFNAISSDNCAPLLSIPYAQAAAIQHQVEL